MKSCTNLFKIVKELGVAIKWLSNLTSKDRSIGGYEVDDTRRQTALAQYLVHDVGREDSGVRGLPEHRVAHESRRGREVGADGGEVEGRHGGHEALKASLLHAVDRLVGVQRLVLERFGQELDVEAEEVD